MSYKRKPDGVFYDAKQGRLMEHQGYAKRIYWSKDMLDLLMREYPTTFNEEMGECCCSSQRLSGLLQAGQRDRKRIQV